MTALALNHITVPTLGAPAVISLAAALGCSGVELRLDGLSGLDDGVQVFGQSLSSAHAAREVATNLGIRVITLAELRSFNDWNADRAELAAQLITIAVVCGADGILLLPRNDGFGHGNGERQASLRLALRELGPMLQEAGLQGFIEPLGFERSSLRSKREVVDAIEALGQGRRFRLVHDTFHHHLGGDAELVAGHTGLVHVSSVIDTGLSVSEMRDSDRVLPDARDRLGSLQQVRALRDAGYRGPVSVTSFSGTVATAVAGAARPDALSQEQDLRALGASVDWLARSLDVPVHRTGRAGHPSRLVTSVT